VKHLYLRTTNNYYIGTRC